jgi:hypothetical protein
MVLRILRGAGLASALAAGLAMAACSSPSSRSETAAQLVPEVQAVSVKATSVHVTGTVTEDKQTTTIDVRIDGNSVAGTLGAYGTSYYVLSLNGTMFIRLSAGFLKAERAPASLCAKICGKYVELGTSGVSQIASFLSMQELIGDVFNYKSMSQAAGSGCIFSPTVRGGQAVLECRQGSYTLDVAAHGRPFLVYWGGPHGQHLAFSEWNSVTLPPAPPANQVVSLSELG